MRVQLLGVLMFPVVEQNGPKAETDKTEIAAGLGRRTKEEIYNIEKWDQTCSPEIPDRGETSEIP